MSLPYQNRLEHCLTHPFKVDLYAVVYDADEESTSLKRVARWNHNYFVTSLVAKGNRLIVGDAISSVSVLEVKGHNLETIARDYTPLWPQAVEGAKDHGVIGSNVSIIVYIEELYLIRFFSWISTS